VKYLYQSYACAFLLLFVKPTESGNTTA